MLYSSFIHKQRTVTARGLNLAAGCRTPTTNYCLSVAALSGLAQPCLQSVQEERPSTMRKRHEDNDDKDSGNRAQFGGFVLQEF